MTAYSIPVIDCDAPGCDEQTHTPSPLPTHTELRAHRRSDGWRTRRNPEGGPLLDLCPKHSGAGEDGG